MKRKSENQEIIDLIMIEINKEIVMETMETDQDLIGIIDKIITVMVEDLITEIDRVETLDLIMETDH